MNHAIIAPLGYGIYSPVFFAPPLPVFSPTTGAQEYIYFNSVNGLTAGSYTFGTSPLDDFGPYGNVPTIRFQKRSNRKFYVTGLTKDGFTIVDRLEGSDALSVSVIVVHEFEEN